MPHKKPASAVAILQLGSCPDNCRTLLGEEGFHTPVGKLSQEHLEAARLYLALHADLLLALEQPRAGCALSFKWGLGWPTHLQEEKGRSKDSYRAYWKVEEWLPHDIEDLLAAVGAGLCCSYAAKPAVCVCCSAVPNMLMADTWLSGLVAGIACALCAVASCSFSHICDNSVPSLLLACAAVVLVGSAKLVPARLLQNACCPAPHSLHCRGIVNMRHAWV